MIDIQIRFDYSVQKDQGQVQKCQGNRNRKLPRKEAANVCVDLDVIYVDHVNSHFSLCKSTLHRSGLLSLSL